MLTVRNTEAIRQIEAAIGYTFRDKRLLIQVLTRKTYLKIDPEAPDNEVLEFYGDTLMNYHVTNYFMAKYAHMLEDGLFFMRTVEQFTDLRSHYVCNRYLTERVKALGLARYLRAQNRDAELRRDGEKAYADVFESLVGAIYLDSYQNDALIRAFILRQLGIEPRRAPAEIEAFDYDSLAHEIPEDVPFPCDEPDEAMIPDEPAEEIPLAAESVDETEEAPVEAMPVRETPAVTVAETATETAAETAAEAISEPAPAEIPSAEEINALTAEVAAEIPALVAEAAPATNREKLAILCEQLGYEQPTYGETPPNAPNARPVAACTLRFRDAKGKQVKISLNDSGKTLAEATEKAAGKMLAKVEKLTPVTDQAAKTEHTAKTAKATKTAKPTKFKPEKQDNVTETPAETASASPIVETPATAEPIAPVSEETVPAEPVTVEEVPAEVPAKTVSEESTPAANQPVEIASAEAVTEEPVSVEEAAVEEVSVEAAAVEVAPGAEHTAEVSPAKAETAVEVIPKAVTAEEAPAETVTEAHADVAEDVTAPKADTPTVEIPAENTAKEETPVEVAPTEDKPKKKAPAKKPASKKPAAKKPASKKKAEAPAVTAPAENTPAEAASLPQAEAMTEAHADQPTEDVKAAKTAPAKKRAPAGKKAASAVSPAEDKPTEDVTAANKPTETAPAEDKPVAVKKPRAPRKPCAKAETAPAEDKPTEE